MLSYLDSFINMTEYVDNKLCGTLETTILILETFIQILKFGDYVTKANFISHLGTVVSKVSVENYLGVEIADANNTEFFYGNNPIEIFTGFIF